MQYWNQIKLTGLKDNLGGEELVYLNDENSGFRAYTGSVSQVYNPAIHRFIAAQHQRDKIFVDVGAHHGLCCLAALSLGMQVFALEPERRNFEVLLANMPQNLHSRWRIENTAASERTGKATLFWQVNSTKTSFHRNNEAQLVTQVETVRLDIHLAGVPIHMIQIHVEGHEMPVLRGWKIWTYPGLFS